MNFDKKISGLRKQNKMSQEEFAELFGVTRQTISSWENKKSYPDVETLIKISDKFAISLDTLLKVDKELVKNWNNKITLYKRLIVMLCLLIIIWIFSSMLLAFYKGFNYTNDGDFWQHYLLCAKDDMEVEFNINFNSDEENPVSLGWSSNNAILGFMENFNFRMTNETTEGEIKHYIESYFAKRNGKCTFIEEEEKYYSLMG